MLNDVNPVAYLAETLDAIINGHQQSQIEELNFGKRQAQVQVIGEALTSDL